MAQRFSRFYYQPVRPIGRGGRRITASPKHIALSRRAAAEGMVLLENRGQALPLKRGERVALFGKASADYVKGGGGSGDVYCPYIHTLIDGMRMKRDEGKISLYEPLCEQYIKYVTEARARVAAESPAVYEEIMRIPDTVRLEHALAAAHLRFQIPELELDDAAIADARAGADTAVISFCRYSSEGWDRSSARDVADFYLTDAEQSLVRRVSAAFAKTVVVLNVGGMIDTAWFAENKRISAALLAWQAGMEGGAAEADVLCGDAEPGGRLTDTFACDFDAYPSSATFNESDDYIDYIEDIFVGYRYFETIPGAAGKVCYPFGFGLSYTSFDIMEASGSGSAAAVTVSFTVKNTGKRAGRQVVQLYCQAPQGKLGKPARVLCGFVKTRVLAPGECETLAIRTELASLASFDDTGRVEKSAWVLEKGEYRFHIGSSVRDTTELDYKLVLDKDRITERCTSYCPPQALKKRLRADGSFEALEANKAVVCRPDNKIPNVKAPEKPLKFCDLKDEGQLDEFMAQLKDEELVHLICGQASRTICDTGCFAGIDRLEVPYVPTEDGPAGVRVNEKCGVPTTAWPCATLLACMWDGELVYKIGEAGAKEMKENNLGIWLTPALNIHRSPLCGRNFEYYSEDPLVAGRTAAAMVRGIQSQGVASTPKHFACNNKEINRRESDSRLSERALREIYLRGFEICVKTADPWGLMTAYNRMNGERTSESGALLTGILRGEWGYKGMITTDWANLASHVTELAAGNDVRMPVRACNEPMLIEALGDGRIKRGDLYASARRVLELYLKLYWE